MDITAVSGVMNVPAAAAPAIPQENAAENRTIVQAVQALNGTEMFNHDNQLTFQRDPQTHRMVVQVVNRRTHEVVSQIPAEYLLRMAEDLKQTQAEATPPRTG